MNAKYLRKIILEEIKNLLKEEETPHTVPGQKLQDIYNSEYMSETDQQQKANMKKVAYSWGDSLSLNPNNYSQLMNILLKEYKFLKTLPKNKRASYGFQTNLQEAQRLKFLMDTVAAVAAKNATDHQIFTLFHEASIGEPFPHIQIDELFSYFGFKIPKKYHGLS